MLASILPTALIHYALPFVLGFMFMAGIVFERATRKRPVVEIRYRGMDIVSIDTSDDVVFKEVR